MYRAIGSRPKGETKLSLTVHRDTTELLPILFDKIDGDAMVPGGCDMLWELVRRHIKPKHDETLPLA
jgi:hypothetical protein